MFVLLAVLLSPDYSHAETDVPIRLDEICITATRTNKDPLYTPNTVHSLSFEKLQNERMVRTVPEALKEIPGIMVQKTSHGQGSPYIRGFTGFRTLFMIDGIRLNNSVFREGPNQYWNTVDPFSIEKLDIVKGPSSVLYGSDAIGGTVNALTIGPKYSEKRYSSNGRAYYRYADAENSHSSRGEVGGSYHKKFGWMLGASYKDFGDVEGGSDVGIQRKTGYDEWTGDVKFEYYVNPDSRIVFAHQNVDQNDAWRSHKTVYGISWEGTTVGDEKKRVLDQRRHLTYLQYSGKNIGSLIDELKLSLSCQVQKEERYRVKQDNKFDIQGVDVHTTGVCAQIDAYTAFGTWTYGVEYYHDAIDSFKKKYNADGSLDKVEIQGPVADDATYDLLGVFVQDDIFVCNPFELIFGIRYTYAKVDADRIKDPATGGRMSLSESWNTGTGSIRALYHIDEDNHYKLFGGVSQGFRAPNLSDLTRYDTARSNEIETAAPDLDPEKFVTYEIGFKTRYDQFTSQVAYFYTDINNMIVRTPTGNVIDGDNEITKKNAGDGFVHGVELSASWRFFSKYTAFGSFSWIDGEVDTYPASEPEKTEEPISRLMPTTYHAGIRWEPTDKCWLEGLVTIAEKQDDLSSRDKSDTQRIPPGGTPGYTVYVIRGGWNMTDFITATAAVENITDEDYRIHGSGLNEPGRNFLIAVDCRF